MPKKVKITRITKQEMEIIAIAGEVNNARHCNGSANSPENLEIKWNGRHGRQGKIIISGRHRGIFEVAQIRHEGKEKLVAFPFEGRLAFPIPSLKVFTESVALSGDNPEAPHMRVAVRENGHSAVFHSLKDFQNSGKDITPAGIIS